MRPRGLVGHPQLSQSLVDRGGGGPDLPAVAAVGGDLQRSAATQHDGVGLPDRLIGGRVQVVAVVDLEPVLLDDVDHRRLHRRHRHRRAVDMQRHGLVCGHGVAAGTGQRQQRRGDQQSQHR